MSGAIFKRKYGKDPKNLTLTEINTIVFSGKTPRYRRNYGRNVVVKRGDSFKNKPLSDTIDSLFDRAISRTY